MDRNRTGALFNFFTDRQHIVEEIVLYSDFSDSNYGCFQILAVYICTTMRSYHTACTRRLYFASFSEYPVRLTL
ncbi:hypothetical protein OUZ56_005344 [Daphnia magna]|uniref:Uncharacterized protein n=1 Tax=Daphnia magna TaxID=35525 RepID=A0ABQ9YSJ5_9CRUS|nr:hypothetical protein OUZ56_005344 [Daphnia magna]